MTTKASGPGATPPTTVTWRDVVFAICTQVDWKTIATAALDSQPLGEAFGESVLVIANVLVAEGRKPKRDRPRPPKQARPAVDEVRSEPPPPIEPPKVAAAETPTPPAIDPAVAAAAALLDVTVAATEKQIRSALRRRLSESRAHPDHGGDGDHAQRLIAARDLFLNRVRSQPERACSRTRST